MAGLVLVCSSQRLCQDLPGLGAALRSVASAADIPRDHGRPDRLLRTRAEINPINPVKQSHSCQAGRLTSVS